MQPSIHTIVSKKISELLPADYNPRILTDEQHSEIVNSIKTFGFVDPAIINTFPGRENIIIGGHQRIKVAAELGYTEVPCVELKLALEQERKLNLILNHAHGEWDFDALANNFDMEELMAVGFTEKELGLGDDSGIGDESDAGGKEDKKEFLNAEEIARVCYNANRLYCQSIGDHSFKDWDAAPEWQKETNIAGVKFRLANPDAPVSAMHENWTKDKLAAGWVYGPLKNPDKKEHPCLIPFGELPTEQQSKDFIFVAIVDSLRTMVRVTKAK